MFGNIGFSRNPIGKYWYHNYHYGLTVLPSETKLTRNDGQTFSYHPPATGNTWLTDADINFKLEETKDQATGVRTGWKVTTPSDTVETYSPIGDLLTITERNGSKQTLTYSQCVIASATCTNPTSNPDTPFDGLLWKVTDNFGRELKFSYNNIGQLVTLTAPSHTAANNNTVNYSYDSDGNLATVTYPDDTPANLSDNPKTTYHYGEAAHVSATPDLGVTYTHAITGITDEAGVRYATYKYDGAGRAVNTEHAGGVEKYGLEYLPDDPATPGIIDPVTKITDPLNSVRGTHFTTILGVLKPTGTDQPGGSGCSAASSNIEYDPNGNVKSRTGFSNPGFDGHKTCYAYDLARNLETARVEGLGKDDDCAAKLSATSYPAGASIRKVSSEWHPNYRLPLRIAEPLKLTSNGYDASGNLTSHSEQATTDLDGSKGFAAPPTGTPRTWTYTYGSLGRITSADGPRNEAGIDDTTAYAYYADNHPDLTKRGNLRVVTRPLGQVVTYDSYNAAGQPTQITAANGIKYAMSYTARGWLASLTTTAADGTTSEATTYTYTPTGLLASVTQPDGSKLSYSYDAAHRLTGIEDNLGNRAIYTLDNMGNRINEKYWDPGSAPIPDEGVSAVGLRRKITRAYDALNRLQAVTGGVQ